MKKISNNKWIFINLVIAVVITLLILLLPIVIFKDEINGIDFSLTGFQIIFGNPTGEFTFSVLGFLMLLALLGAIALSFNQKKKFIIGAGALLLFVGIVLVLARYAFVIHPEFLAYLESETSVPAASWREMFQETLEYPLQTRGLIVIVFSLALSYLLSVNKLKA